MSHMRLALGFPRHRKVKRLSNDAFCLWVNAMHHARDQGTDGLLDDIELDDVPRCPPRGAKRTKLVTELVTAKLWDVAGKGWQIHDYTDWQDSAEQVKAQRDAACTRAKTYRVRRAARLAELSALVTANVTRDARANERPDLDHDHPSSSGSRSPEGGYGGNQAPPDNERETVCPLDLEQKALDRGIVKELAEALGAPEPSVLHGVREFVSYWTIGDGAGKTKSFWMKRLRDRIRRQHLDGHLKPPGAIEHDARNGRESSGTGFVAPSKYLAEAQRMVAERGRE